MRRLLGVLALLAASPVAAEDPRPGEFDYYVLALSWTPSWCAAEGDARSSDQCDAGQGFGFTLHGLWPQYEEGWPSWCRTDQRDPSRRQTAAMADIMGSAGLAWHQWKKHGRCSGLSADDYFSHARQAFDAIRRPPVLREVDTPLRLPPAVVEEAFLEVNTDHTPDSITVTCRDGRIAEVRLCLTRDLSPRSCARDVRRDCNLPSAHLPPMR